MERVGVVLSVRGFGSEVFHIAVGDVRDFRLAEEALVVLSGFA
jgi:hypothetical protein